MSLFGWTAKEEGDATTTGTTHSQTTVFARARVFGAAALQPFSVLRPFYERPCSPRLFRKSRIRRRRRRRRKAIHSLDTPYARRYSRSGALDNSSATQGLFNLFNSDSSKVFSLEKFHKYITLRQYVSFTH